jgi:hypothetical protein
MGEFMLIKLGRFANHRLLVAIAVTSLVGIYPLFQTTSAEADVADKAGSLNVVRNGAHASVTWIVDDPNQEIKIFRNNVLVSSSKGNGHFDDESAGNGVNEYRADMSRPLSMSQVSLIQDETTKSRAAANPSDFEYVDSIGLKIAANDSVLEKAQASSSATSTIFRYQTFIPQLYVSAPAVGCSASSYADEYFVGDNRGFGVSSTSYRTRLDATVNWSTGTVSGYRDVGTTYVVQLYNGSYNPVAHQTAPNTSMTVDDLGTSTTKAAFRMKQNIANPFCNSNGLYFDINVYISRSGGWSLNGTRLRVPNHEIYIKDSDAPSWTTVMQDPYLYFAECLTPAQSTIFGCLSSFSLQGSR